MEIPFAFDLLSGAFTISGDFGLLGQMDLWLGLDLSIEGQLTAPAGLGPNAIVTVFDPLLEPPEAGFDVGIDFNGDGQRDALSRVRMQCAQGEG